ncbi:ribonuclease H-like domain-containing protein [Tanacetum coccineum]
MISMRLKKFYKKTGRKLHFDAKEPDRFDKSKVECYNCLGHFARECRLKGSQDARRRDEGNYGYKVKDNGRRPGKQEETNALVTLDGEGIDWTAHAENEQEDFSLMAFNNTSSDTEVISCLTKCVESYSKLKKLYDEQREQLSDANIEILAYSQGLKKVEAQLVTHQNNQLWYEQKISYMKIDLDDKTDVLTYHKKLLAEALKEKEDLNTKFENWKNSSENLSKLLNTQMSACDKFGLGYGNHRYGSILSYENEVLQSVFINKESNTDDKTLYDRFVTTDGMHAVPPPMTGNYMPSGPDIEIDDSQFTYGPKQPQSSKPDTRSSDFDSYAPIIEEYKSDSDDENVTISSSEQEQPRETVLEHNSCSQSPKVNKNDLYRSKSIRMGLGNGGTRKGCYVCGSFSHLIRDCDFHEKRMAKKAEMNKKVFKNTNPCNKRTKWNNAQKMNNLNQFVPSAVLTRTGKISINTSDDPQRALKNKGIVDSGWSRHITGNKGYLVNYQDYNGGPIAFGGSKGQITGKGKIRTGKLNFDDVCFVKELQ